MRDKKILLETLGLLEEESRQENGGEVLIDGGTIYKTLGRDVPHALYCTVLT